MTNTPPVREGDNAWVTLRRRKVVQWGLVYGAAAWGFLQGLEYISGTYDWPRQIQQLTTLALLIGFPIVLVLAWYHGDRGEQRFADVRILALQGRRAEALNALGRAEGAGWRAGWAAEGCAARTDGREVTATPMG